MQWYNDLESYHQKTTKNQSRKKQRNRNNLARPFHNQVMNLNILIFGTKLMLLFRMFYEKPFKEKLKKKETWYYIVYGKFVIFKAHKFEACYWQS